jgi:hypothetical protein
MKLNPQEQARLEMLAAQLGKSRETRFWLWVSNYMSELLFTLVFCMLAGIAMLVWLLMVGGLNK